MAATATVSFRHVENYRWRTGVVAHAKVAGPAAVAVRQNRALPSFA
jgi:hypothetical protein